MDLAGVYMTEAEEKKINMENELLRAKNQELLRELQNCRDDICLQMNVMSEMKKEIRRYQVQINSLKTENEELKNKFAKIENNIIGRLLLKIYRWIKEIMRRRG